MASEKKKRKTDKRLHWGRGGNFLKEKENGIKGVNFYTSSLRQKIKRDLFNENKYLNFD